MSSAKRPEMTTRLPSPFDHISITYPYNWPGFTDGLHVANARTGRGNVYEGVYASALANGIIAAMEGNPK